MKFYQQTNVRRKAFNQYFRIINQIIHISRIFPVIPPLSFTLETQFCDKRIADISYPDQVRLKALDLVAKEISTKNIIGSVAEVGVFQGEFAKYINQAFPDRTLYLFDTFTGFDKNDLKHDTDHNYYKLDQDFSKTSENLVISKMKHPEKCVVKKGYFPESLNGMEDTFSFVSLDTDLYKPILEGLNYFYPRLSEGGFVFVHDYNNTCYEGVKVAVDEFAQKNTISLFPLPDWSGTVVIMKPYSLKKQ